MAAEEKPNKSDITTILNKLKAASANKNSYFQEHNVTTKDAQQKYNSRAAELYRGKVSQLAHTAMRQYGCQLLIDTHSSTAGPVSPDSKHVDFWDEHTNDDNKDSNDSAIFNRSADHTESLQFNSEIQSNLSVPEGSNLKPEAQKSNYKPIIGAKKTSKKSLGAKRGLGAQKVNADFKKIEEEALKADELKEVYENTSSKPLTQEEAEENLASINLAYQDLSERQKLTEEKLRSIDPQKAQQLERLGMGFTNAGSSRSGISHSAVSDMTSIEQVNPTNNSPSLSSFARNTSLNDKPFSELQMELMMLEMALSSGPSRYKEAILDKSFGRSKNDIVESDNFWDVIDNKKDKAPEVIDTIPSLESNKTSNSARSMVSSRSVGSIAGDEAQKKFGTAKAISSDQFFGDSKGSDFERRTTLSRFEGSNSISSDDYFGRKSEKSRQSSLAATNLYDIKEGVKDGVTKVAGRLSNLATGVMSSLQ
ncbi:ADP-ribosylation factor GTPase-activating protein 2-like protein, partial [Leptotrombidium deliense]